MKKLGQAELMVSITWLLFAVREAKFLFLAVFECGSI